jgi:hypothetical protein
MKRPSDEASPLSWPQHGPCGDSEIAIRWDASCSLILRQRLSGNGLNQRGDLVGRFVFGVADAPCSCASWS